jgi:hypothetical protein
MRRLQLVGTQRSGSNLFRLILGSLPGVFAPPSAHELRDFLELIPLYSPLADSGNVERLIVDIGHLIDLNALPWPQILHRNQKVADALGGTTIAHVVIAFCDAHAQDLQCNTWLSKCLENLYFVERLAVTKLPILYVHLVRDPRDVALSFANAPIGPRSRGSCAGESRQSRLAHDSV